MSSVPNAASCLPLVCFEIMFDFFFFFFLRDKVFQETIIKFFFEKLSKIWVISSWYNHVVDIFCPFVVPPLINVLWRKIRPIEIKKLNGYKTCRDNMDAKFALLSGSGWGLLTDTFPRWGATPPWSHDYKCRVLEAIIRARKLCMSSEFFTTRGHFSYNITLTKLQNTMVSK